MNREQIRKMAEELAEIDYERFGDALMLKFGGDGDNGETLIDILEVYFEGHPGQGGEPPV